MDKVKHFLVSAGLVIGLSFFMPLVLSVLLTIMAGIVKEMTDAKFDVYDLFADILGITVGVIVCLIK